MITKEQVYLGLLAEVWVELFPDDEPGGSIEECAEQMRQEIARLKETDYAYKGLLN